MTKRKFSLRPASAAILLGSAALGGIVGGAALASDDAAIAGEIAAPGPAAVMQSGVHATLADMVEAVGPSVVQIQVQPEARSRTAAGPMTRDEALRRFFGQPSPHSGRARPGGSLGSGFIVDPSGLVVTNNHVVANADVVTVQLSDGRELEGRVLGRDDKTDVAVVQITQGSGFQAVDWGDSDGTRVGDSVFAVGSPFGLGNTVTSGIVSARGREIGGAYDDFLQVDAAINSGNSGGPLFDASGRVIGVNTAIFTPSGGNVGIGFAIPAHLAREIATEIVQNGSVSRGRVLTKDLHRTVIIDINRGTRFFRDLANRRTTLTDDVANLVLIHLQRCHARRVLRGNLTRRIQHGVHLSKNMQARFQSLLEGALHDFFVDTLDLDIHLQRGHTFGSARYLEVHITQVILVA